MAAPEAKRSKAEFPPELEESLKEFHNSLKGIEKALNPLFGKNISELQSSLEPLEQARLDLTSAYALNSLFWMYLNCTGDNPKEHGIKQELDRIKGYMQRAKTIEDKAKAPKIDRGAAKRFVRGSLWDPKQKERKQVEDEENTNKCKKRKS